MTDKAKKPANQELEPEVEIEVDGESTEESSPGDRMAVAAGDQVSEKTVDDEAEEYSARVRKRIDSLVKERSDAQRLSEAARAEAEHLKMELQRARHERDQWRQQIEDGTIILRGESEGRIKAQLETAKAAYKRAFDEGDTEAMANAVGDVGRLNAELAAISRRLPEERDKSSRELPAQTQAQPVPQAPRISRRQQEWAAENPWFMTNPEMTALAAAVHDRLRLQGVRLESDEYYGQIDAVMRKRFPEEFDDGDGEQRETRANPSGNVVAPVTRTTTKPRTTVKLSPHEISIAQTMGLTPQQYAAEKLKLAKKEA